MWGELQQPVPAHSRGSGKLEFEWRKMGSTFLKTSLSVMLSLPGSYTLNLPHQDQYQPTFNSVPEVIHMLVIK